MTTTNYQLADTLPKDTGGDKFIAWVNETGGSDLHFLLPRGIGKQTAGSKLFGSLGVGSHTAGSAYTSTGVGIGVGGVYLSDQAASANSNGTFGVAQVSKYGELLTNGVAKTATLFTGSVNTIATASYLYGYSISASDASDADSVIFRNGLNTILHHYFQAGTKTEYVTLPVGGIYFGESGGITVENNITTASITLFLER